MLTTSNIRNVNLNVQLQCEDLVTSREEDERRKRKHEGMWCEELTRTTASRAAMAMMSAHETMPGHEASKRALASFTASKPSPANDTFGSASLSAPLIKMDASHPYTNNLEL